MDKKKIELEEVINLNELPREDYVKNIDIQEHMKILLGVAKNKDNIELTVADIDLPGMPILHPSSRIEIKINDTVAALDILNKGYLKLGDVIVTRTNPDKSETCIDVHISRKRLRGERDNIICFCTKVEKFYKENNLEVLRSIRSDYKDISTEQDRGSFLAYCTACPYIKDDSCIIKQYMEALSAFESKETVDLTKKEKEEKGA